MNSNSSQVIFMFSFLFFFQFCFLNEHLKIYLKSLRILFFVSSSVFPNFCLLFPVQNSTQNSIMWKLWKNYLKWFQWNIFTCLIKWNCKHSLLFCTSFFPLIEFLFFFLVRLISYILELAASFRFLMIVH